MACGMARLIVQRAWSACHNTSRIFSKRYVLASILCSFGGFLLGIDTSIIGPVTVMESFRADLGELSSALHGLVVSEILLSAAIASFFAGRPADKIGRIPAIAIGASILCVGTVMQAAAVNMSMFAVGRLIEGLGYGLFFGTQTVYICEISPPKHRGPLTAGPQFLICVGLVAGYFTCYGTTRIEGSLSWRLPFILLSALAAVYVVLVSSLLPASPRWLIENGRAQEADKVWDMLDIDHTDRRRLEEEIRDVSADDAVQIVMPEAVSEPVHNGPARWKDLFANGARDQTLLAVFMMGFMQLCGIDAVLYYSPLLFQQAGLTSSEASFFASGISGIVIVATSIPALLLADKFGRRSSTVLGGLCLTTVLVLMAALYASSATTTSAAARYVVIVCIYLFCVIDATTWAIAIKVYAPEIQPQQTRAHATSLAYGFNWICNWFVTFIAPIMLAQSSSAVYWLFGGCTAIATIVSFLFMVETKGRTFEEIDRAFSHERQRRKDMFERLFRHTAWPFARRSIATS